MGKWQRGPPHSDCGGPLSRSAFTNRTVHVPDRRYCAAPHAWRAASRDNRFGRLVSASACGSAAEISKSQREVEMYMRIIWGRIRTGQWERYEAAYKEIFLAKKPVIDGLKGRWLVRDVNDPNA